MRIVRCRVAALLVLGEIFLSGCGFVDSSVSDRIDTLNHGYGTASNSELLTNIVRASHYEPLRFYSHRKFSPSQTSDWKIGLPDVVFGPGKSASAREYAFSGNIADNSVSVSEEIDPVESHDFHNSILTPITPGVLGIFLQNFPRELVFMTLFSAIRFDEPGQLPIEYRNEPSMPTQECPAVNYSPYDPDNSSENLTFVSPYHPPGTGQFADIRKCPYQRFVYWVEGAVAYGLTVDFSEASNPKYDITDTSSKEPKTIVQGRFCLDPALARADLVA